MNQNSSYKYTYMTHLIFMTSVLYIVVLSCRYEICIVIFFLFRVLQTVHISIQYFFFYYKLLQLMKNKLICKSAKHKEKDLDIRCDKVMLNAKSLTLSNQLENIVTEK